MRLYLVTKEDNPDPESKPAKVEQHILRVNCPASEDPVTIDDQEKIEIIVSDLKRRISRNISIHNEDFAQIGFFIGDLTARMVAENVSKNVFKAANRLLSLMQACAFNPIPYFPQDALMMKNVDRVLSDLKMVSGITADKFCNKIQTTLGLVYPEIRLVYRVDSLKDQAATEFCTKLENATQGGVFINRLMIRFLKDIYQELS